MPPGSHGILGFVTDVPGEDRTLNHVQWADDPDPAEWQARRDRLRAGRRRRRRGHRGRPVRSTRAPVSPAPSTAAPRYTGAVGHGDLSALMGQALTAAPRALVYGYLAELDLTGHVRGVDSAAGGPSSRSIDRIVEQVVDGLPDDAALLVTADHGMLDVPGDDPRRPRRRARPRPTASACSPGSPAPGTCTPSQGAADDVLAAWRDRPRRPRLGRPRRDEAVASGVFGRVDDALAARIGDVVALARGSWALSRHRARARPQPADRPTTARSPRRSSRSRCCWPAGQPSAEIRAQRHVPGARVGGVGRPAGQVHRLLRRAALDRGHDRRRPGRPA